MTTGMLKVVAPPQITTPPEDQSVTEGMFVELVCETTGLPQPEVCDFQLLDFFVFCSLEGRFFYKKKAGKHEVESKKRIKYEKICFKESEFEK